MNRENRFSRIYLPLLFLTILVASGLRATAAITEFNPESGYFNSKGLIIAAGILAAAGAFLLFTYAFVSPKISNLRASFSTPATYIPTGITAASLILFAAHSYSKAKSFGIPIIHTFASKNSILIMNVLLSLFALFAAVYFVMNALLPKKLSVTRASFGVFAILFFALYAAYLYFDTTLPLNAPNKIVDQMAYLFTAIFFLYEIRISLGRECWNLYIAFGFISALLCAYSSIPSVILYFSKRVTVSNSIEESALTLCLCIFVICRVILATTLPQDEESDFVKLAREAHTARNSYLEEKHEIERRAYLEVINRFNEVEETKEEISESQLFDNAEQPQEFHFEEENTDAQADVDDSREYDTASDKPKDEQAPVENGEGEISKSETAVKITKNDEASSEAESQPDTVSTANKSPMQESAAPDNHKVTDSDSTAEEDKLSE